MYQCSAVQCITVQCSTVKCSVVQCSGMQCSCYQSLSWDFDLVDRSGKMNRTERNKKIVQEAPPLKCEHCDFKAETTQHLKIHMNVMHQGFKCDCCEYKNLSKNILNKHMQKKHKLQSNEK